MRELPDVFRRQTIIGVMAAAAVPLQQANVRASLRWLQHKLDLAKDAARPPGGGLPLPDRPERECVNCQSYLATHTIEREDRAEHVCKRCHEMARAEGIPRAMSTALVDVSACERSGPHQGRLAAVSADGNNLGAFFEKLVSLEELAAASDAVDWIFRHAHDRALEASNAACRAKFELETVQSVPLITGGDDVRVFLPPSGLVAYAETLARVVEESAAAAGDLGGLLRPETTAVLRQLGVGIGAVVAEDHFPARRLMQYAHELEKRAKSICREPASGVRSALDLEIITSTQTVGVDPEDRRKQGDGRPFALTGDSWQKTRTQAQALYALPAAQRRVLDLASTLDEAEFANLFRYQVARSEEWKRWYKQCGIDWCDRDQVIERRPGPGLLALGSLLTEESP